MHFVSIWNAVYLANIHELTSSCVCFDSRMNDWNFPLFCMCTMLNCDSVKRRNQTDWSDRAQHMCSFHSMLHNLFNLWTYAHMHITKCVLSASSPIQHNGIILFKYLEAWLIDLNQYCENYGHRYLSVERMLQKDIAFLDIDEESRLCFGRCFDSQLIKQWNQPKVNFLSRKCKKWKRNDRFRN